MDRTRFYPTERNHLALVTMIIPEAHERLVHTMRSTRECKACITTRTRGAPAANAGLLLHLLARRAARACTLSPTRHISSSSGQENGLLFLACCTQQRGFPGCSFNCTLGRWLASGRFCFLQCAW